MQQRCLIGSVLGGNSNHGGTAKSVEPAKHVARLWTPEATPGNKPEAPEPKGGKQAHGDALSLK